MSILKRMTRLRRVRELFSKMERAHTAEAENRLRDATVIEHQHEDAAREIAHTARAQMSGGGNMAELDALVALHLAQLRSLEAARKSTRAATERAAQARLRLMRAEKNVEIADGLVSRTRQAHDRIESKLIDELVIAKYARRKSQ